MAFIKLAEVCKVAPGGMIHGLLAGEPRVPRRVTYEPLEQAARLFNKVSPCLQVLIHLHIDLNRGGRGGSVEGGQVHSSAGLKWTVGAKLTGITLIIFTMHTENRRPFFFLNAEPCSSVGDRLLEGSHRGDV